MNGRDKLPDLAPQSGPWKYPPRRRDTTARRDAWIFAAGVALALVGLGAGLFITEPAARIAAAHIEAQGGCYKEGC